jgi:hypothetical protein
VLTVSYNNKKNGHFEYTEYCFTFPNISAVIFLAAAESRQKYIKYDDGVK